MAARLIPKTDESEFPYEEVRRRLFENPSTRVRPFDFGPMIEAGKRMGWTEEMIRTNEELSHRGRCFAFEMTQEPFLRGTLYEDNVFFSFSGAEHERASMHAIEGLAREFDVRVLR